jgi:hypothetical protein
MTQDLSYKNPIFHNLGRNDACPCGSGKKYKKCHGSIHDIEREAAVKHEQLSEELGFVPLPHELLFALQKAADDNVFSLFWERLHEDSPWRSRYDSAQALFIASQSGALKLPLSKKFSLLRFRVDAPDVHMLLVHEPPRADHFVFHVVSLRYSAELVQVTGEDDESYEQMPLKLMDITEHIKPRAEVRDPKALDLADLGFAWNPGDLPKKTA